MLFDARGNPIPLTDPARDTRTRQQRAFDRDFRQAMGSGGGPGFPPQLVEKVKNAMIRRDLAKPLGLDPGTLEPVGRAGTPTPYLDDLADAIKHASDHRSKHGVSVIMPSTHRKSE